MTRRLYGETRDTGVHRREELSCVYPGLGDILLAPFILYFLSFLLDTVKKNSWVPLEFFFYLFYTVKKIHWLPLKFFLFLGKSTPKGHLTRTSSSETVYRHWKDKRENEHRLKGPKNLPGPFISPATSSRTCLVSYCIRLRHITHARVDKKARQTRKQRFRIA